MPAALGEVGAAQYRCAQDTLADWKDGTVTHDETLCAARPCPRGGKLCKHATHVDSMILCIDGFYLAPATASGTDMNYITLAASTAGDNSGFWCLGNNSRQYIPYALRLSRSMCYLYRPCFRLTLFYGLYYLCRWLVPRRC